MSDRSASGYRNDPLGELTAEDICFLIAEINEIAADASVFRFNEGEKTGFSDRLGLINVRGDVFPDNGSLHPRDRMSARAVLAHEYYGHYEFAPSKYEVGDWRDEMRASYVAAIKAPHLSNGDRKYLLLDAYERAKEAGHYFKYSAKARQIIYGY